MTTDIKKVKFSLRVPEELNNILLRMSQNSGITKNALIITALWKFVKEK